MQPGTQSNQWQPQKTGLLHKTPRVYTCIHTFKAVLPDLTISNKLPSPSPGSVRTFFLADASRTARPARLPRFPVLCTHQHCISQLTAKKNNRTMFAQVIYGYVMSQNFQIYEHNVQCAIQDHIW